MTSTISWKQREIRFIPHLIIQMSNLKSKMTISRSEPYMVSVHLSETLNIIAIRKKGAVPK